LLLFSLFVVVAVVTLIPRPHICIPAPSSISSQSLRSTNSRELVSFGGRVSGREKVEQKRERERERERERRERETGREERE